MRLALWFLGIELLAIETSSSEADPDADLSGGTTYSTPIGFVDTPGDQRWERGVDYQ